MESFSDLNDEIIADDWLIPSEEISMKRLVRQTPRFNVYKADWFGDVLVYEPISQEEREQKQQKQRRLASRRQQQIEAAKTINFDALNSRLNCLNLGNNNNISSLRFAQEDSTLLSPLARSTGSNDSAYSSISSTPRYNKSEFEFPSDRMLQFNPSDNNNNSNVYIDSNNNNCNCDLNNNDTLIGSVKSEMSLESIEDSSIMVSEIKDCSGEPRSSEKYQQVASAEQRVLVLNKNSFNFYYNEVESGQQTQQINEVPGKKQESTWSEMNELRLIAHENFMLFMGASINGFDSSDTDKQATSLVMQMNHPKAICLFNLLHNLQSNSSQANQLSALDRFLVYKQQQRPQPQLGTLAKLNICQQVTNAMAYLHDRNIVHGKLMSINIYLEMYQRVKISLIDDDFESIATTCMDKNQTSLKRVEFNLPSLTYLSPELIRTIRIGNATSKCDNNRSAYVRFDTDQLTKRSDVFSFGTLLFELFEGRFPFAQAHSDNRIGHSLANKQLLFDAPGLSTILPKENHTFLNGNIKASANELIYQIGSGQMETKNLKTEISTSIQYPAQIGLFIGKCWSNDPSLRPNFKQLTSMFNNLLDNVNINC